MTATLTDRPVVHDDRAAVEAAINAAPGGEETAAIAAASGDPDVVELAAALMKALAAVDELLEVSRFGALGSVADLPAPVAIEHPRNGLDDLLAHCDDAQLDELNEIPEWDMWWLRQGARQAAADLAKVAWRIDTRLVEAAAR